jgi:hypothetical protein
VEISSNKMKENLTSAEREYCFKMALFDGIKNNPKGKNKKQHTTVTTDFK